MISQRALLALVLLLLGVLAAGCDCNSGVPVQSDGGVCPTECAAGTFCCGKSLTCEPEQRTCSNLQSCPSGQEIVYPSRPYMDENTCEPIPLQCSCKPDASSGPGMVGRFSALAAAQGTLLASAYETKYGDLLLVTVETGALDGAPTMEIIDGVPAKPPSKPVTEWRGGVTEPGDDVGLDTDIAVSASGEPIIVYHDATNRSLKAATRAAGKWATHTIEAPKGEKDVVGRYGSLVLLDGKPAVAYLALQLPGNTGTFNSELRWAVATSASPAAAADWTITSIEVRPMSCQNLCAATEACVLQAGGGSACQAKGTGCATCLADEACVSGACKKVLAEAKYVDIPRASGLWPAAARASSGPVVVYYDRTTGRLRGAGLSGGTWKKKDLAGSGTEDVGAFPAAFCDGGAVVHVTYQDAAQLTLKYLQLDAASLTANTPELVDDGVRADGPHPVGADSAVLLDPSGAVRVVYQDALRADLLAARRTGPNQWAPKVTTDPDLGRSIKGGPKGYGFYSDLVLESGQVYGSTFFYDAQGTPKGGLSFFKLP